MAATEEKISFVLYSSYEEQLNLLSNEQAGELMKAIFVYARTGEKQCQDPMVTMMLGFISYQMDIDARKYAESKERRREAASKAGKISAEKRAMKKAEELLISTDLSISETGEKCGFSYSYYFAKVFRNFTGYLPGEYRKNKKIRKN